MRAYCGNMAASRFCKIRRRSSLSRQLSSGYESDRRDGQDAIALANRAQKRRTGHSSYQPLIDRCSLPSRKKRLIRNRLPTPPIRMLSHNHLGQAHDTGPQKHVGHLTTVAAVAIVNGSIICRLSSKPPASLRRPRTLHLHRAMLDDYRAKKEQSTRRATSCLREWKESSSVIIESDRIVEAGGLSGMFTKAHYAFGAVVEPPRGPSRRHG